MIPNSPPFMLIAIAVARQVYDPAAGGGGGADKLLLEGGDDILLESGDFLLKE